jgi:two-component system phosphate regulon sensor histidine kinase PhoR
MMTESTKSVESLQINKLERILGATTDGIITLDKQGQFVYANAAAEKILGVCLKDILQRSYNQTAWKLTTLKGEPLPDAETPFKKVLQENQGIYGLKLIIERPDGEKIIISTNAAPLYDDAGHFDGVVGVFTDVTEQQGLLEMNNIFHQTVAHDLRTPLTVIHGHAEMLLDTLQATPLTGCALQNVEEILAGSEKMAKMIDDLLDTARIERGQVTLNKEPIALQPFVESLLQSSAKGIDSKRIEARIPRNLPLLFADPARLERILLNLLSNALKFSPEESKVIILAHKNNGELTMTVTDHGKGISPEDCSRLFRRFFQVKGQNSGGVGLGLYISKILAEAHGGHLWVVSTVGKGSTFSLSLPTE